jgi:hypothetical protein
LLLAALDNRKSPEGAAVCTTFAAVDDVVYATTANIRTTIGSISGDLNQRNGVSCCELAN